jgi:hypothetical protein
MSGNVRAAASVMPETNLAELVIVNTSVLLCVLRR